jgi:hypothetical protein
MEVRQISINPATSVSKMFGITQAFRNIFSGIYKILSRIFRIILSPIFFIASRKKSKLAEKVEVDSASSKKRPRANYTKLLKFLLFVMVSVGIVIAGTNYLKTEQSTTNDRQEVKGARKSLLIDRELIFPLRNGNGEEVSNIKYTIEKAELRDEIIVKGQKATAIKGRTFLILTLKIRNEYESAIEIDTRDYVRISINGNRDEWLAPDIHNDPVEVQAISTKYTRLGFPINDSDRNFVLSIGEIDGEKTEIELDL